MTPEQQIMAMVIARAITDDFKFECDATNITSENVDELFDELTDAGWTQDYLSEIREGDVETMLSCESSRHYESKSVAAKCPDGRWVGWTFWYGGGKHGEPEAIDWRGEAHYLDCKEEEKLVIVRTFSKAE